MAPTPIDNALHHPHDSAFKSAMSNYEVARDFFKNYLPDSVRAHVDLSVLEIQQETFLDKELSKSACDLLYRTRFRFEAVEEGYLYLLAEHQSQPDFWLPYRMLGYQLRIWDKYKKQNPEVQRLPLIVPLVFYTGDENYNHSMCFLDYFNPHQVLASDLLVGHHKLIDVSSISDEEIHGHRYAGLMEMVMKYARERDTARLLKKLNDFYVYLKEAEVYASYVDSMLYYVFRKAEGADLSKALKKAKQELVSYPIGEEIMNLEEYLLERGRKQGIKQGVKQGRQQGMQEATHLVAERLLSMGMPVVEIAKATKLKIEEVVTLQEKADA